MIRFVAVALLAGCVLVGCSPDKAEAVGGFGLFGGRGVAVNVGGGGGVNVDIGRRGFFGRSFFGPRVAVNRGFGNRVFVRNGFFGPRVVVRDRAFFAPRARVFAHPFAVHSFAQPVVVNHGFSGFGGCGVGVARVHSFGIRSFRSHSFGAFSGCGAGFY